MVQTEIGKLVIAIGLLSSGRISKKKYQMGISIVTKTEQAWEPLVCTRPCKSTNGEIGMESPADHKKPVMVC